MIKAPSRPHLRIPWLAAIPLAFGAHFGVMLGTVLAERDGPPPAPSVAVVPAPPTVVVVAPSPSPPTVVSVPRFVVRCDAASTCWVNRTALRLQVRQGTDAVIGAIRSEPFAGGQRIVDVRPGSVFAALDLRAGDVVFGLDDAPGHALAHAGARSEIRIELQRGGVREARRWVVV